MTVVLPTAAFTPDSSHALQSLRLPGPDRPTATTSRVSASMSGNGVNHACDTSASWRSTNPDLGKGQVAAGAAGCLRARGKQRGAIPEELQNPPRLPAMR